MHKLWCQNEAKNCFITAALAGGSRAAAIQQQQLLQQQMPPALFDMFYEELLTDLMKTGDLVMMKTLPAI